MSAVMKTVLICDVNLYVHLLTLILFFFFFNDTATTEIYTLSLHDALPILEEERVPDEDEAERLRVRMTLRDDPHHEEEDERGDRKSTRLNSSHLVISYAVFCLKKKNDC